MSFERPLAGTGPGAEPPPTPPSAAGPSEVTVSMRLQILSTEHWSLLASRSLAWNEAFSRGGMFLATLSGAIVALALVAQATEFGEGFRIFGLVILPVVLFVGVGTAFRIGMSNYHDARTIVGMNRIRSAYLEIAPDLERYFVMGTTDDEHGFALTQAMIPGTPILVQMFASSPMLVSVLNGVVAGAVVALLLLQLAAGTTAALVGGIVAGIVVVLLFLAYAAREIRSVGSMSPLAGGRPASPEPEDRPAP